MRHAHHVCLQTRKYVPLHPSGLAKQRKCPVCPQAHPVCLQVLEDMQAQGLRLDVGVYNTAIDILVRSGVLAAQQQGLQLYQAANRQGLLR